MPDEHTGASPLLEFTDKDGGKFWLSPKALHHIKHDNCIGDLVAFIRQVFSHTLTIVESRWSPVTHLYYGEFIRGKSYAVVVANISDRRIKTAYKSPKIKGGDALWINSTLMN